MFKSNITVIVNEDCPFETHVTDVTHDLMLTLMMELGYSSSTMGDFLRKTQGLDGRWAVLSALYAEATHKDVIIRSVHEVSSALSSKFMAFMAEGGYECHQHQATSWLVKIPYDLPKVETPYALIGASMRQALKPYDGHPWILKLMTEGQMFLSQHQRDVNALWIWGGSELFVERQAGLRPLIVCGDATDDLLCLSHHQISRNRLCRTRAVYYIPDPACYDRSYFEALNRVYPVRWYWKNALSRKLPDHWFWRYCRR